MQNTAIDRNLLRTAQRLWLRLQDQQLSRRRAAQDEIGRLVSIVDDLRATGRKWCKAWDRRWFAATGELEARESLMIRHLQTAIGAADRAFRADAVEPPRLAEAYADLESLKEEFSDLRCSGSAIAVVIEPIELEGIQLGPFEISLRLDGLSHPSSGEAFEVVALEPNPAATDAAVTHPHVQGARLCSGDAGPAITDALAGGRICDFFMIVRSVLNTYNPHSPYVSLDNWSGVSCGDCGEVVSSEESYLCPSCEQDYCPECMSICCSCEESACHGCLETCPVCEERICQSCVTACPSCEGNICPQCRDDEQCHCLEEHEENDDEGNEDLSPDRSQSDRGPSIPVETLQCDSEAA